METIEKTKLLTELAKLLEPEKEAEKSNVNQVLEEILARLKFLESNILSNQSVVRESLPMLHASQQKFQIAAANEIFLPNKNEKACRFEPDKPCDYCSMCSALGF